MIIPDKNHIDIIRELYPKTSILLLTAKYKLYTPNNNEIIAIVNPNLTKSFSGLFENEIIELTVKQKNILLPIGCSAGSFEKFPYEMF